MTTKRTPNLLFIRAGTVDYGLLEGFSHLLIEEIGVRAEGRTQVLAVTERYLSR